VDSGVDRIAVVVQGVLRDQGVILLCTSSSQTLTSERQNALSALGKRNRLAQWRVHRVAPAVRMLESVLFPHQFIRVDHATCDVMVRPITSNALATTPSGPAGVGGGGKLPPLWVDVQKLCNICVLSFSWNFFVSHDKYIARPSIKEPR